MEYHRSEGVVRGIVKGSHSKTAKQVTALCVQTPTHCRRLLTIVVIVLQRCDGCAYRYALVDAVAVITILAIVQHEVA